MKYGEVLNNTYQIIGEIGAGGGGVVYQAKHLRLETDVVVKQIRDEVRGKIDSKGEANVLKNLKHTYLPKIYDFIENEDGIYTVMDYIPGESLDKVLHREKKIPQKRALKWARQLGEALKYLHSQTPPIIHSDIKPSNIIITPDDDICLIDFNISMALDSHYSDNRGLSAGYAAPEQYGAIDLPEKIREKYENETEFFFEGDDATVLIDEEYEKTVIIDDDRTVLINNDSIRQVDFDDSGIVKTNRTKGFVDTRSDIYSLGCVLYHMTTGIIPSKRPDKIIPIFDTSAKISEGFATVIEKMMQYQPTDRYRNGIEYSKIINEVYKLDKRYVSHRRKENALLISTFIFFLCGAFLLGIGIRNNLQDGNKAVFEDAYSMYLSGDYMGCLTYCEEIMEEKASGIGAKNTDWANYYYLMANSCYELSDYKNAVLYIESALAIDDSNPLFYRDYGVVLAKNGYIDEAHEILNIAVEKGLAEDSIYFLQGEINYEENNKKDALSFFEKTINSTSDESLVKRATVMTAQIYEEVGNVDMVIGVLESAITQADSGDTFVLSEKLGAAYMKKGDMASDDSEKKEYWEKSLNQYSNLLEKGYSTRQMMENVAILSEETGDLAKAQDILISMLDIYPNDYRIYKRLSFLEADIQSSIDVLHRDYSATKALYDEASRLYKMSQTDDPEMVVLGTMIEDLESLGWTFENITDLNLTYLEDNVGGATENRKKTLEDFVE